MKHLKIFSLVGVAFLMFASLIQADTIELKDGKLLLRVKIQKEGLLKVEYKKPGLPTQYVDSLRVKEIKYDSTGNEYKAAKEAVSNQAFREASDLYLVVADKSDHRPVFRAHCLFKAADYAKMAADWNGAVEGFTLFCNEYPDHRLYPAGLENRAIALLNRGDPAKAKSAFGLFQKKVKEKGLPDYWKFEAEYWMNFMLERENPSKASKVYRDIYDKTKDSYPTIANKARLRIGRVLMQQKQYKNAVKLFDEIIDNRDPNDVSEREVLSWAYLSRGHCVMNMPMKGDGKAEFKAALYDMLRAVYHYEDVGSTQAEGMFWAGKCFQSLGGPESGKKWQALYRRIQREWPGTQWAQLAAKEVSN